MLLLAGLDVNSKDKLDMTPLHYAAVMKNGGMLIQELLRWGANAKAENTHGEIPLHLAVKYGRKDSIKHLAEKGVCNKTSKGYDLIRIAMENNQLDVIVLLLALRIKENTVDSYLGNNSKEIEGEISAWYRFFYYADTTRGISLPLLEQALDAATSKQDIRTALVKFGVFMKKPGYGGEKKFGFWGIKGSAIYRLVRDEFVKLTGENFEEVTNKEIERLNNSII